MATKPDTESISPYAYAFADDSGKPKSQQEVYDQESAMARRLQREAGFGPDSSLIAAKQLLANQTAANNIRVQEQLLSAKQEAIALRQKNDEINQQNDLASFYADSQNLNPKSIGKFRGDFENWEKKHFGVLYSNNSAIREQAQARAAELKKSHDDYARGAVANAQAYGMQSYPEEALDKNGEPDFNKLSVVGMKFYNMVQERDRKERERQEREKADIQAEEAIKKQKSATEEYWKRHPEEKKRQQIKELDETSNIIDKQIYSEASKSGLPKEHINLLFDTSTAKLTDASGKPDPNGTHYTWKSPKKGGSPIIVNKQQADQARERIKELTQSKSELDQSMQDIFRSGSFGDSESSSQSSTPSGIMVYDPNTGTLKPKE